MEISIFLQMHSFIFKKEINCGNFYISRDAFINILQDKS